MHLFLTDRLACPRCGPGFGLILFADVVRDQRVLEGELGCSNCREQYPVREGFGDFRFPRPAPTSKGAGISGGETLAQKGGGTSDQPGETLVQNSGASDQPGETPDKKEPEEEEVVRIGALLGVTEGPGTILLTGLEASWAGNLARLIGDIEVVGMDPELIAEEESGGVSRIAAGSRIPFSDGTFRGVLSGRGVAESLLGELARVVAPGGHLVILDPDPGDGVKVEGLGLALILEEERAVVARRETSGPSPLVTLRGL